MTRLIESFPVEFLKYLRSDVRLQQSVLHAVTFRDLAVRVLLEQACVESSRAIFLLRHLILLAALDTGLTLA